MYVNKFRRLLIFKLPADCQAHQHSQYGDTLNSRATSPLLRAVNKNQLLAHCEPMTTVDIGTKSQNRNSKRNVWSGLHLPVRYRTVTTTYTSPRIASQTHVGNAWDTPDRPRRQRRRGFWTFVFSRLRPRLPMARVLVRVLEAFGRNSASDSSCLTGGGT